MTNASIDRALERAKSGEPKQAGNELALEVSGLSHSYGHHKALDNLTFSIKLKEFVILLGLNGAGKTTLFSLITRLFDAQQGEIRIFGQELRHNPGAALRLLGAVFQARTLDLDLSVAQNLNYHAALHGIDSAEARARAEEVLRRVQMLDRAHSKARNLSGGQMRRVEIARALVHRPKLLLLDEPTVGLDIDARSNILRHVRDLAACQDTSVLWATHLIDEVAEGDSVIILHRGKIVAHGVASDLVKAAGARDLREAFATFTHRQTQLPHSAAGDDIERE